VNGDKIVAEAANTTKHALSMTRQRQRIAVQFSDRAPGEGDGIPIVIKRRRVQRARILDQTHRTRNSARNQKRKMPGTFLRFVHPTGRRKEIK
jgi:hypothetical protein